MKRFGEGKRHYFLPFLVHTAICFAVPPAQAAPKSIPAQPKSSLVQPSLSVSDEPVLLEAEQIDYDHDENLIVASGDVEVTQGETVVLADRLIYNQETGKLRAEGNVSMLEPSGNVYFADALDLHNNMKTGVVQQFKARLSDDSLFAASQANKIDEDKIELYNAVYSPCKVKCTVGTNEASRNPLWQLRADHILVDQKEQEVIYDNAFMEVYGVPVIYSPYFSHATPGADNQSGLLMPEYQHSNTLGSVFKIPFYYAIAPDKDATFTPIFTTSVGPVLAAEYRQMFDAGQLEFGGSITNAPNTNPQGDQIAGHEIRGDISGRGAFQINETYDWGFDFHRATDDTYLRRYGFSNETLLTSRVFAEGARFPGTNDRSYGIVEAISFQGLTAQDNSEIIPVILPLASATFQSDPGIYNSRFTLDANLMSLYRDTGPRSRRMSAILGWKLPYISDDGQVIEFDTQMRTDVYSVTDVMLSNGREFSGVTGRAVPQATVTWRYPIISRMENSSFLVEPIVSFTGAPGGGNPEKIPNEDSLVPEFTDTNLFSSNRFAGLDRIESGSRMSYGLRGQAQFYSDKYVDWLIGQQYRIINDPNFPISNDLTSHFSDYVGKLGINYQPFTLAYRFRLDEETLAPRRSEVDAGFNYYPLYMNVAYLSLKGDPVLSNRQQIAGSAAINLTKNWIWTISANRDLLLDRFVSNSTGLTYQNECTNITGVVGRQYTEDRDIRPATTFLIRVFLKNLD